MTVPAGHDTDGTAALAPELRRETLRWIADDVDEAARGELQAVLARAMAGDRAAVDEVRERMGEPLRFGTAGLRAPVRAGRNGMNVAVVTRTTAGVARWLADGGHAAGTVVVGRDARTGSEAFAAATAEVFAGAGFDTRLLPEPLPTPVLAFAVRHLDAVAGVQITASHNPPADNGYKLYDGAGTQIVPPADTEIERAVAEVGAATAVARSRAYTVLGDDIVGSYVDSAAAVPRGTARDVRIALTPMHGVGGQTCVQALRAAGFTDVHVVREQAAPDPAFPTVTFPNPEEPGAADRLLELAADVNADLAVALDPDADRCAVGVPERGTWRMLRGDETGCLLAEYVLSHVDTELPPLVATTVVSSSLLGRIAAEHDARYDETPTGFKWLVRSGDGAGTGLVFAYEEALGLCVAPDVVRDKDGISAAVLAADLAATLKAGDRTIPAALDELQRRHGVHRTGQLSLRFDDLTERAARMRALRADPPARLLDTPVHTEDLLPGTDALRITGESLRVVVRPSGTEPKLKSYAEISLPPGGDPVGDPAGDLDRDKATAADRLQRLVAELTERLEG